MNDSSNKKNEIMKIAVMLSGGVDSAVAAHLLKKAGYDITCFTLRLFENAKFGFANGNGAEATITKAAEIAKKLKLEHKVIDLKDEFEKRVVDYFCESYFDGLTPNPCVVCNKKIKWGALQKVVQDLGYDKLASGHYAQIVFEDGCYRVFSPLDKRKDQTYVLWKLTQKQLANIVFPLADFTKKQIKQIAIKELGLDVAQEAESQDVCFISRDYQSFLVNFKRAKPGKIYFRSEVVGQHQGCFNYTIGQRRGLNIAYKKPLYVKKIDAATNGVYLCDDVGELYSTEFFIHKTNWLSGSAPKDKNLGVKVRYNTSEKEVSSLEFDGKLLRVKMRQPVKAITKGQSAVFYCKKELIGGGEIC